MKKTCFMTQKQSRKIRDFTARAFMDFLASLLRLCSTKGYTYVKQHKTTNRHTA